MGDELRRLRKERKWTQEKLEEVSGVGQSTISAIERGHQEQTSLEYLRRLAGALDVPLNNLLAAAGIMEEEVSGDRHDAAPLREVEAALRALPGVSSQLDELSTLPPKVREELIRSLARRWSVDLDESLRLVKQAQLNLPE